MADILSNIQFIHRRVWRSTETLETPQTGPFHCLRYSWGGVSGTKEQFFNFIVAVNQFFVAPDSLRAPATAVSSEVCVSRGAYNMKLVIHPPTHQLCRRIIRMAREADTMDEYSEDAPPPHRLGGKYLLTNFWMAFMACQMMWIYAKIFLTYSSGTAQARPLMCEWPDKELNFTAACV